MCGICRALVIFIHASTGIDSVGKMPSGISDGNYHWLGDYEQCVELKE